MKDISYKLINKININVSEIIIRLNLYLNND